MLRLLEKIIGIDGLTWGEVILGLALVPVFWFGIVVFLSL